MKDYYIAEFDGYGFVSGNGKLVAESYEAIAYPTQDKAEKAAEKHPAKPFGAKLIIWKIAQSKVNEFVCS